MNRFMFNVVRYCPHLTLAFAAATLVLVILNYFNPLLGFLSTTYSKVILILFCICALFSSLGAIVLYRDIMGRSRKNKTR
ncbi:MAG: hypothetical protein J6P48_02040 [Oscillospiraceae bacterium]|nr:hypothetical protein [Oscillospiraceae bacterium]